MDACLSYEGAALTMLLSSSNPSIDTSDLHRVRAQLEILNVLHTFMDAINRTDKRDLSRCFAKDATLATYYVGSSAPRVHHGRESIVRFLENTWLVRKDVSVFERHMVMNTVFLDVSEQTAYARSSFLITRQEMASFKIDIAYAGQYVDELYASDEGWLISHRTVRFG
jgi:hypothetical protein